MPQGLIAAFYFSLGWLTRLSLGHLSRLTQCSLGLFNKVNTLISTLNTELLPGRVQNTLNISGNTFRVLLLWRQIDSLIYFSLYLNLPLLYLR
jgi:hypothetical protein